MAYDFIKTSASEILAEIMTALENGVSEPLYPGDERRIFGESALTPLIVGLYNSVNDACRQKMLRYARGEVLDMLGENWHCKRIESQKAKTVLQFYINTQYSENIIIRKGVRVTNAEGKYLFETDETVVLPVGFTSVNVNATAVEGGEEYNNITEDSLTTIVDLSQVPLIDGVTNISATAGGADREDDETYRERIRTVDDAVSTAGPKQNYRYWAIAADPTKVSDAYVEMPEDTFTDALPVVTDPNGNKYVFLGSVDFVADTLEITGAEKTTDYTVSYNAATNLLKISIVPGGALDDADSVNVSILKRQAGVVRIAPIGFGGEILSQDILDKILESCTQEDIVPMTDRVEVVSPDTTEYDIDITVWTTKAEKAQVIEMVEGDNGALAQYNFWQCSALNRDINPDYLRKLILSPQSGVGATMVEITSPVYMDLSPTTIAQFSGTKHVTYVEKEGVV